MIGLALNDFSRLEPEEFQEVCHAYYESRAEDGKGRWEMIRTLACVSIQPHIKQRMTPKELLPLPWDKVEKHAPSRSMTKQERLERARKLLERVDLRDAKKNEIEE